MLPFSVVLIPIKLLSFIYPPLIKINGLIRYYVTQFYVKIWDNEKWNYLLNKKIDDTDESVLYISNHRSILDVFLYLSQIPHVQVFAKKQLFFVPILNLGMWMYDQIPFNKNTLDKKFKMGKKQGRKFLIFPELTRAPLEYDGMLKFSLLPFKYAIKYKIPIVPLLVKGTDVVCPKNKLKMYPNNSIKIVQLNLIQVDQDCLANELMEQVRDKMQLEWNKL